MSYQQLNPEERLELYRLKQTTNLSIRGIAKKMGRSHATISRELRRNQHPELESYLPDTAQSQAFERRQQAKLPFAKFTPNVIVGIEQRPAIADQKTEIGHWEGDTIIGGNHLGAVATYVDKTSKFLVARVMKTRTSAELNRATEEAFAGLPTSHLKTFTFDNGKEFSGHEQLGAGLGVECYFANPYHSWERGLNEHTNGLIRQFFPKGTNFSHRQTS